MHPGMTESLEQLRYPIGRFAAPEVTAAQVEGWIADLEQLPPRLRSELGAMALLGAEELREISRDSLARKGQARLESLAERQKKQPLSDAERSELHELVERAQSVMLHRAEARRAASGKGSCILGAGVSHGDHPSQDLPAR